MLIPKDERKIVYCSIFFFFLYPSQSTIPSFLINAKSWAETNYLRYLGNGKHVLHQLKASSVITINLYSNMIVYLIHFQLPLETFLFLLFHNSIWLHNYNMLFALFWNCFSQSKHLKYLLLFLCPIFYSGKELRWYILQNILPNMKTS